MTGTFLNIATVLLGGTLGLLLGQALPERTRQTVMNGLGLMTAVIGMQMALTTQNVLIVMFSVLAGGIVGEWWQIEAQLERFGDWLQQRLSTSTPSAEGQSISRAFVTASLVFCVGPLTILGAIQDGLNHDYQLLAVKSILDGFAAMAFATTLGWGVLLSVITLLVYQGGISLAAMLLVGWAAGGLDRDAAPIIEMTATGGVLILGIALLLLDLRRVRVANFLPAIAIAPLLAWLVERLTAP